MAKPTIYKQVVKPRVTATKNRESGHYWVMWSGRYGGDEIWRIGAYLHGTGWHLTGDDRLYFDTDFIKINENRIPVTKGPLYGGLWFWVTVILNVSFTAYYAYYQLTHR